MEDLAPKTSAPLKYPTELMPVVPDEPAGTESSQPVPTPAAQPLPPSDTDSEKGANLNKPVWFETETPGCSVVTGSDATPITGVRCAFTGVDAIPGVATTSDSRNLMFNLTNLNMAGDATQSSQIWISQEKNNVE
jgi:hypothetical protein